MVTPCGSRIVEIMWLAADSPLKSAIAQVCLPSPLKSAIAQVCLPSPLKSAIAQVCLPSPLKSAIAQVCLPEFVDDVKQPGLHMFLSLV